MALIEISLKRKNMKIDIDTVALNQKIGSYLVSSTQRKIRSGISPANAALTVAVKGNDKPLRDRGQLMASITAKADASSVRVGTNHIAAKTMQYGMTIKAKGKWLWIPAGRQTRTWQRRYGFAPGEVMKGLKADGYNTWTQSKKGSSSGVVMAKKGKRGKLWVVFILKKSVTIPARPFLYFDEMDLKIIRGYLRGALSKKPEPEEVTNGST
jgi:phage gpG-like protein